MNYKDNSLIGRREEKSEHKKMIEDNEAREQNISFYNTFEGNEIISCCLTRTWSDSLNEPQYLLGILMFINENLPKFPPSVDFLMIFGRDIFMRNDTKSQFLMLEIIDNYAWDYRELFNLILDDYMSFLSLESSQPPETLGAVVRILVDHLSIVPSDRLTVIISFLYERMHNLEPSIHVGFLAFVVRMEKLEIGLTVDDLIEELNFLGQYFLGCINDKEKKDRERFIKLFTTLKTFPSYGEVVCNIIDKYLTFCVKAGDECPISFQLLVLKTASIYSGVKKWEWNFCQLVLKLFGILEAQKGEKLGIVFAALSRCLNETTSLYFEEKFILQIFTFIEKIYKDDSILEDRTKCGVLCFIHLFLNVSRLRGTNIQFFVNSFDELIEEIIKNWSGQMENNSLIFHIMHALYEIKSFPHNNGDALEWLFSTYKSFLINNSGSLSIEEEEEIDEIFDKKINFATLESRDT